VELHHLFTIIHDDIMDSTAQRGAQAGTAYDHQGAADAFCGGVGWWGRTRGLIPRLFIVGDVAQARAMGLPLSHSE